MLYTPRFCCHCGDKIDREKWGWFSSRRFCENCEIDFPLQKWIPLVWLSAGAILFLFGFGSFLKKTETAKAPEIVAINKGSAEQNVNVPKDNSLRSNTNALEHKTSDAGLVVVAQSAKPATLAELKRQTPEISGNRQNSESEKVFYCGAQTKKGTPCTRRVRGGGRCWQHRGQPALPTAAKLVVAQ